MRILIAVVAIVAATAGYLAAQQHVPIPRHPPGWNLQCASTVCFVVSSDGDVYRLSGDLSRPVDLGRLPWNRK